jgi:surface protein
LKSRAFQKGVDSIAKQETVMKIMKKATNTHGASAVEYSLLLMGVSAAAIIGVIGFGATVEDTYSQTGDHMSNVATSETEALVSGENAGSSNDDGDPLILVFNTSLSGDTDIAVPLSWLDDGTINAVIDWGDGSTDIATSAGLYPHSYTTDGTYYVTITGQVEHLGMAQSTEYLKRNTDEYKDYADNLVSVDSFGDVGLKSLDGAFAGVGNLKSIPQLPDSVTSLALTFAGAGSFSADITGWDVSNVSDMSRMFELALAFNQNISGWDVSNVEDMQSMFKYAASFNQDIGGWDVSNVTNMFQMLEVAIAFNQDIGEWDVSHVTNMSEMFYNASSFDQNIGEWNVSNVEDMSWMFNGVNSTALNIDEWDVSNVESMYGMFYGVTTFSSDLSIWDVSNVTDMTAMFRESENITTDISGWDVSNVTEMSSMFRDSKNMTVDISEWDISSVSEMDYMFYGSTLVPDFSEWDFNSASSMKNFISGSDFPAEAYDTLLQALYNTTAQQGTLSAEGVSYTSAGENARTNLIEEKSWSIDDAGLSSY